MCVGSLRECICYAYVHVLYVCTSVLVRMMLGCLPIVGLLSLLSGIMWVFCPALSDVLSSILCSITVFSGVLSSVLSSVTVLSGVLSSVLSSITVLSGGAVLCVMSILFYIHMYVSRFALPPTYWDWR